MVKFSLFTPHKPLHVLQIYCFLFSQKLNKLYYLYLYLCVCMFMQFSNLHVYFSVTELYGKFLTLLCIPYQNTSCKHSVDMIMIILVFHQLMIQNLRCGICIIFFNYLIYLLPRTDPSLTFPSISLSSSQTISHSLWSVFSFSLPIY